MSSNELNIGYGRMLTRTREESVEYMRSQLIGDSITSKENLEEMDDDDLLDLFDETYCYAGWNEPEKKPTHIYLHRTGLVARVIYSVYSESDDINLCDVHMVNNIDDLPIDAKTNNWFRFATIHYNGGASFSEVLEDELIRQEIIKEPA